MDLRRRLSPLAAGLGFCLALAGVGPAAAQSLDIGLNFLDISAGSAFAQGGDGQWSGRVTGDFRIGPAQGLQFDLGGEVIEGRFLGQVDLHLYLAPDETHKYGFFASLADLNDTEFTVGVLGIAAMAELAPGTIIEGRAGAGMLKGARGGNVDFVTVSGGIFRALSAQSGIFADVTVSQFEEASLSATGHEIRAGFRRSFGGGRGEVVAGLSQTGLEGRDGRPAETAAFLGVTWRLGGVKGQDRSPAHRAFTTFQPARPLLVLGRY